MHTSSLDYTDGIVQLEGFLAYDTNITGPRPAVLIAHDWTGRGDFPCKKAEEFAAQGYVAFALDMYGKGVFGSAVDVELNSSLMNPLVQDRALLRGRVRAALDTVSALDQVDSSRVAAFGYCFGGMCVLELARSGAPVAGVVSIHGILSPGGIPNQTIRSSVLCLHGHDDPMVPPEQVLAFEQEMSSAGADWQVHAYGGTLHAFTNPEADNPGFGAQYNATADHRSSESLRNFLAEVLRSFP